MSHESITSLQNPRVKNLVKLRDRRHRDRTGYFLIEGYRELSRALARKVPVREIYFSPDWFLGENEFPLLDEAAKNGIALFELTKLVFRKCSYRDRPDGLIGVADQTRLSLHDLKLPENPLLLVCEKIEKPGNLGTLLRGADAAGADAVIVCDPVTDIFNPNVVRASTGVLFSIPLVVTEREELIDFLRTQKICSVATTPDTDLLYTKSDLRGPIALLMGSEQYGLSPEWLAAADVKVRIPMAGQADSLNVAMAAIVTLFEAVRQRGLS
ncbi:MAG TPA: RNA methyltransferase [Opitutales bacterium]|nr:RNA methyltransferase [Opitutales bacterium]